MKPILILLALMIGLDSLALVQNQQKAKIRNTSSEKLHFSYENKFGEIKSVWIDGYKSQEFLLENVKQRITFEYNSNLFPCIIKVGDELFVERQNNVYKIKNCENSDIFFELSERFSILKSTFFGIAYNDKIDYKVIVHEIDKFKTNRLNFVEKSIQNNNATREDFIKMIDFRYIDELLAPIHQEKFTKLIIPTFYKEKIEEEIEKVMNKGVNNDQICLLKQYFYGILKYKLLTTENSKNAQARLDFVIKYYKNSYLKNYIIWKLYQEDFLNKESKTVFENYFRSITSDKDYINRIDTSWK